MAKQVWSIMVWLYPADHLSELERVQRLEHHRPRGWRTRAFNPPALDRLPYGHYDDLEAAEAEMQELAGRLGRGEPLWIRTKQEVFLIPAHSVQYAVLAEGQTETDSTTASI